MKDVIKRFLRYWKKGNHAKMYGLTTKTWQASNTNTSLKSRFAGLELQDYVIVGIEGNEAIRDVKLMLKVNGKKYESFCRLVCERTAYKVDPNGVWGVNPISILRFDNERQ